jgi:hypothetical protein
LGENSEKSSEKCSNTELDEALACEIEERIGWMKSWVKSSEKTVGK